MRNKLNKIKQQNNISAAQVSMSMAERTCVDCKHWKQNCAHCNVHSLINTKHIGLSANNTLH